MKAKTEVIRPTNSDNPCVSKPPALVNKAKTSWADPREAMIVRGSKIAKNPTMWRTSTALSITGR